MVAAYQEEFNIYVSICTASLSNKWVIEIWAITEYKLSATMRLKDAREG
jgi:hypothetical protein